jgi:hypothetical protein
MGCPMKVLSREGRRAALIAAAALLTSAFLVTAPAEAQNPAMFGICDFPIIHEFPKVHGLHGHPLPPAAPYEGFDTGQVIVEVINADTGKSITISSNGVLLGADDGTEWGRGQIVWFLDHDTGHISTGAWVVNGTTHVIRDDTGKVTTTEGGLVRRDLCAELA